MRCFYYIVEPSDIADLYRKELGMKSDLVNKLIENAGVGHIAETLSKMPGTSLNTLLMEVLAQHAQELAPTTIEVRYRENRLVVPCKIEQYSLIKADVIAYQVLDSQFKGIELSPVMPLGVNAVLGGVNQRNVLGAIRNCEVLADPTTALTLECVLRRRVLLEKSPRCAERVRLATSARCMRLQRFDDIPGFVPHFKIFALATAGRDTGSELFEVESMREHVQFYLEYLSALKTNGYDIRDIHVDLSDVRLMRAIVTHHELDSTKIGRQVQMKDSSVFTRYKIDWPRHIRNIKDLPPAFIETYEIEKMLALLTKLDDQVIEPLRRDYPMVTFSIDLDRAAGMNYYTNACFKIWALNGNGDRYPLVDGGFADWTQKVLQSRKERLFTSGVGTELILSNFT